MCSSCLPAGYLGSEKLLRNDPLPYLKTWVSTLATNLLSVNKLRTFLLVGVERYQDRVTICEAEGKNPLADAIIIVGGVTDGVLEFGHFLGDTCYLEAQSAEFNENLRLALAVAARRIMAENIFKPGEAAHLDRTCRT